MGSGVRAGWVALGWSLLQVAGCGDATTPSSTTDAPAATHTSTPSTAETGTTTDTDSSCAGTTVAMTAARGPIAASIALTVTTSEPVGVAVRCSADGDPSEAHLLEDATLSTGHELHLLGLLPDTDYTCLAVPTCPSGASPARASLHTAAPEAELATLEVERHPKLAPTGAWTLSLYKRVLHARGALVVWDLEGRPRWWHPVDPSLNMAMEVLLDPDRKTLVYGGGRSPFGIPTVVDLWDGTETPAAMPPWEDEMYHHDGKRLPDGRLLGLQAVANHVGPVTFEGFGVRTFDPATGAVEVVLDSQVLLDAGSLPPALPGSDPYHINWLDLVDTSSGPVLYASSYTLRRILAIDATTKTVLWDLRAGQGWTVLDADGTPLPDDDLPQGQHGPEVDGDELWVYDNGVERGSSRVERWRIDRDTHTATRLWWWTEPGWFEATFGDVDVLGGGRILITQGTFHCCETRSSVVEIDVASGEVVGRWTVPEPEMPMYRAERYDGCSLFSRLGTCSERDARDAELAPLFAVGSAQ